MITVEKRLQLRSHKIVAYTKFTGYSFRSDAQKKSAEKLEQVKTYTGELKFAARKRLAKAIDLMVQTTKRTYITNPDTGKRMPFQIAFTTLTVHSPERNIEGKEGYKNLLAPFLQWLRRSHNCYLYIWKAELQERGQLHYHLLLGSFVPQGELRLKWNELQQKNGYLDMYFKEHGHYNAPSTEIKNALEHKDIAGYLIKEVAKTIQNKGSINSKVWDCSQNLKEISFFETDANKYAGTISQLVRESKLLIGYSDQSCTVYKVNGSNPTDILDRFDSFLYKDHIDYIKNMEYSRPDKIPLPERLERKVQINFNYNLFLPS